MKYKNVPITSRTDGSTETGMLFECDVCGQNEFLIYQIKGHPHLQCINCDTTFCQNGSCDGAEQLRVARN
jgi:hypothetical protein